MIEAININKSFGDRHVLKDVSVSFEKGKTNLIIGQSGMGKTVLLKCLIGLTRIDSGKVLYDGVNFSSMSFKEMKGIRRQIGMLFQGGALFDSLTVEENIIFPLSMFTKLTVKEKKERANFCLSRVNLSNANKLLPAELSGGMKKRVAIARAIAVNPNYLFCDEPNSGLDPQTATVIDELIMEITHEFDMTTIVVTHDMNSVMGIGEKIMFLSKGNKLWEGSNQDIMDSGVKELDDFVFTNKIMKNIKNKQSNI